MKTNYETKLNEEIESQLEALSLKEVGSEESKSTIDGLTKLMDRSIKLKELEIERTIQREKVDTEYALKKEEFENDKRSKKIENAIKIGTFAVTCVITIGGVIYTTNFEREDNYSSTAGKNFVKRITSLVKI